MLCVAWYTSSYEARADERHRATIEFNRDVRPILSDKCFQCHGPDEAARQADLRLDMESNAKAVRDGRRAIVPGDSSASELYRRITASDEQLRMPPADSGHRLTAEQIAVLRRWIEQGALWQPHWSLMAPRRPEPPVVRMSSWLCNPIDAFVLARMEREGLQPSPEADKTTLIRRLSLDLTGLPPTPAEVDTFLADHSPGAYENLIERLLASHRYGERMASRWLDAARYADTNGYQTDGERIMWRWRDWVIDAYNRNMPFDQFTVEQLAGDLLPDATLDQKIATGFNRNHRGNGEGGIIPEEYAVEYVVDRVDTTATVWLGLTLGCCRCHDHKFDRFSQKEYYLLFAYFNNVPERGKAVKFGNSPPIIKAPTARQQEHLAHLDRELAEADRKLASLEGEIAEAQHRWESAAGDSSINEWTVTRGLQARLPLPVECPSRPSPVGPAACFDGQRVIDAGNFGAFGFNDKFSLAAWVRADDERGGTIVSRMVDAPEAAGYSVRLVKGTVEVALVVRWLDDSLRVRTRQALPPEKWHHVCVTYDGSRWATGLRVYIDGIAAPLDVQLDDLNQTFKTEEPLRIGAGHGPQGRFHGAIADVRVYATSLTASEALVLSEPMPINALAALSADHRSARQASKLKACFLEAHAPNSLGSAYRHLQELRRLKDELYEIIPTTMVMEELAPPRATHVLLRGVYNQPGERVSVGVPASLPPLPRDAEPNRLGLARWLVDPANPLTARVAVNRAWQMYFGTGLVRTVDDFGSQGEWPSHPELLDWLATEFVRTGWDVKALHKLIVTSATYRQSSQTTSALWRSDPENRLLARGPRARLSAEMIRDQALYVSGLLVEGIGGPSVKPYQAEGLWKELTGTDYEPDKGENLYRRSLYTFWKRTIAPPSMATFDAATREVCVVRETRTNTPLQALTLMNDLSFVEAARVLAQRMMNDGGSAPEDRISYGFRLCVTRNPKPSEMAVLMAALNEHLAKYAANPQAACELASVGEAPRDERLKVSELAAYTALAGLLLNLDETITKQ